MKYKYIYFVNNCYKYKEKKNYLFLKIIFIAFIFLRILIINNITFNEINIKKYINKNFLILINKFKLLNLKFSLNKNKAKIENIFILIEAIPFIKKKIIIKQKNNKEIYELFENIFKMNNKRDNGIIIIRKRDYLYIIQIFKELINYKWELIPTKIELNFLRYIINNYYNEKCLIIFDKALNLNFKYYIKNNKNKLVNKDIINLMSKNLFNYFYRKYWNL